MNCDVCNRKLVQNEDASWDCLYCGQHYGPWDGADQPDNSDICSHSSCDDCTDCPR